MRIAVINKSAEPEAEVLRWVRACAIQLTRDFAPHWGYDAQVRAIAPGARAWADEWQMFLVNRADEPGYLGYHDRDRAGKPRGFVCVETTREAGGEPSMALSHELLEMTLDPWLWGAAVTSAHKAQAVSVEACDPVEADRYEIEGVAVSNFVLPGYFDEQGKPPYDFLKRLSAPFTLSPGGYLIVWNQRKGWHDVAFERPAGDKPPKSRTRRIRALNETPGE